MKKQKDSEAYKALEEKKRHAKELLARLNIDIGEMGSQPVNWADVGSMTHVIDLLNEVDQFVNGK